MVVNVSFRNCGRKSNHHYWEIIHNKGLNMRKRSSGFPTRVSAKARFKPVTSQILSLASLDKWLSNKQIIMVLIRLRGCAGWSAPLLFANPQRQVFSIEAHKILCLVYDPGLYVQGQFLGQDVSHAWSRSVYSMFKVTVEWKICFRKHNFHILWPVIISLMSTIRTMTQVCMSRSQVRWKICFWFSKFFA